MHIYIQSEIAKLNYRKNENENGYIIPEINKEDGSINRRYYSSISRNINIININPSSNLYLYLYNIHFYFNIFLVLYYTLPYFYKKREHLKSLTGYVSHTEFR